jgi:hypothetical protein
MQVSVLTHSVLHRRDPGFPSCLTLAVLGRVNLRAHRIYTGLASTDLMAFSFLQKQDEFCVAYRVAALSS